MSSAPHRRSTCRQRLALLCVLLPTAAFAAVPGLAPATPVPPAPGPTLELRLRNEHVDDAAFTRAADATTLRMRVGYRTPVRARLGGVVEIEATKHLGSERFNSSANGRSTYPTVVDPDNTELHQAYLQWTPNAATQLRIGRQRLAWDNQRFIGNSGWRQNEQTFDALDLQNTGAGGWQWRYGYLARALRANGSDNPDPNLARWLLDAQLLGASHPLWNGNLGGYAYFIDNRTLPGTSHRDLGLRYSLHREKAGSIGWLATVEFARQDPYADGSKDIGANYSLVEGGAIAHGNTIRAGWEHLGGNGRIGFATPLATLHAFNGWADHFLVTPPDGLDDRYLGWNRKFGKLEANVAWHDFRAAHGDARFGNETDASLGWSFRRHWNVLAKFADFRAGDIGVDVRKTWLALDYVR
jgi:hypothetical protein